MSEQLSGRELDKAIALLLGYSVKKRRLIAPDGNPVKVATHGIGRFSEDVELREVVGDDDFLWAHAPAFHADANAVIAVCAERGWRLSFGRNLKKDLPYAAIEWDDDDWDFVTTHGATPQEAAARALLAAITAETGAA